MEAIKNLRIVQLILIILLASCGSSNDENDIASPPLLTLSDLSVSSVNNIFYPPFLLKLNYASSCGDEIIFNGIN